MPDLKQSLYLTIIVWVKRLTLLASHPFLKNIGHWNLLEILKNLGIDNQLKYLRIEIDRASPDLRLLCAFFPEECSSLIKSSFLAAQCDHCAPNSRNWVCFWDSHTAKTKSWWLWSTLQIWFLFCIWKLGLDVEVWSHFLLSVFRRIHSTAFSAATQVFCFLSGKQKQDSRL